LNVVSLNIFDAEADAVTLLGNTFSFLATDGLTLTVDDDTPALSGLLDIGSGATVRADVPGAGPDFVAIDADDVRIRGGLTGAGRLIAAHRTDVDDLLTIDEGGELWGAPADAVPTFQPFLRIGAEKTSGVGLVNNGTIRATSPGPGNTEIAGRLSIQLRDDGTIDLDGSSRDGRWELDGTLNLGVGAGPLDVGTPALLVGDLVDVDGLFIGDGVSAADARVRFRGRLSAGLTRAAGRLDFDRGAEVRFDPGSFFEVDLLGRSPGNDASLNRHDLVTAEDATIDGGTIDLDLTTDLNIEDNAYAPPLYFEHTVLLTDAADGLDGTMGGVFDRVDGVVLNGLIAGTDVSGTALAVTYTDAAVIVQRRCTATRTSTAKSNRATSTRC
ncbi:MAG: hypothetical protein AAF916_07470, partial [Planctomycetota bacterium]